jgi:response regulator RpfG family c-di-GMP phosphodiesterase
MSDRILCVDDDPAILAGFQRNLRRLGEIDIAPTGGDALQMVEAFGPYAVVVADMHMPGMDGVTVLSRIRELSPDTVRLMLTGAEDGHTAAGAVNQGQIFRFLAKPCPPDELAAAVAAAVRQHHLAKAERDLLQRTLTGTIQVLTSILAMVDPHAVGTTSDSRERIREFCTKVGIADAWEVEIASMLHGIGWAAVPPSVAARAHGDGELTGPEREMIEAIPETGARMLAAIPRLEGVSEIVRLLNRDWDGAGAPRRQAIPAGARALRVLLDHERLVGDSLDPAVALGVLRGRSGCYDPAMLDALATMLPRRRQNGPGLHRVALHELRAGMILRSDIETATGQKLMVAGRMITDAVLERIMNFARVTPLREPITIEERAA